MLHQALRASLILALCVCAQAFTVLIVLTPDWFTGSTVSNVWTQTLRGGSASMTGNSLILDSPAGSNHDNITGWVQFGQTISNADIPGIIVAMGATPPKQSGNSFYASGLAVMQDTSNGLYCNYNYTGFGTNTYQWHCIKWVSGTQSDWANVNVGPTSAPPPYYLEIIRSGDNWTAKYSTDQVSWLPLGTTTQAYTISTFAIYGNNYNVTPSSALDFAASFDFVCDAVNDKCVSRRAGVVKFPTGIGPPTTPTCGANCPPPTVISPPPSTAYTVPSCIPARVTVTCNNNSGDPTAIQSALNGAGNVAVNGTCSEGAAVLSVPASTCLAGNATLNSTNTQWQMQANGNDTTIQGLTFVGAGMIDYNAGYNPQRNLTIANNVFRDITSGTTAVTLNSIQTGLLIYNNTFKNIAQGGYASISAATTNDTGGAAIENFAGLDNSSIVYNHFNQIGNDAFHGDDSGLLDASNSAWTSGTNATISYNDFSQVHRIMIEWQGIAGNCWSGHCDFSKLQTVTVNRSMKGNYGYNFDKTYYQTWCYGNMPGWNTQWLNNFCGWTSTTATRPGASGFEINDGTASGNLLFQGNVGATTSGIIPTSGDKLATGSAWVHFTAAIPGARNPAQTWRNNLTCGPHTTSVVVEQGTIGQIDDQYHAYSTANCPNALAPQTSNISMGWTSANNQNFPSGGNGTWTLYVGGNLPVRFVNFYIDSSTTPVVTQELSDVNTGFAATPRWNYHATFDTSSYHGSHTILATATDVSGTSQSISQSFTGPP